MTPRGVRTKDGDEVELDLLVIATGFKATDFLLAFDVAGSLTGFLAGSVAWRAVFARLLRGYRGQPPADARAVTDTLLRVSALLETCPEVLELDINPLKVQTRGALAVDVRVRVGHLRPGAASRRVVY